LQEKYLPFFPQNKHTSWQPSESYVLSALNRFIAEYLIVYFRGVLKIVIPAYAGI
jgi:hypothetical protein